MSQWFILQKPKSLDETPLHYVDAPTDLAELCDLLKQEKEIAVDLEVNILSDIRDLRLA